MNTNRRATLTAFGTTGVLLAASLTMLAIVSALVTFDAWPTRTPGAAAGQVAIERAPAARVIRSVRRASAITGRRAGSAGTTGGRGGALASAGRPSSPGGGDGGGGGGNPGNSSNNPPPVGPPPPTVGSQPPGEDPTAGPPGGPTTSNSALPSVHEVTCTATATVSGVAGVSVGGGC
jgi:hypothetical protein